MGAPFAGAQFCGKVGMGGGRVPHRGGVGGIRRPIWGDIATGFVRMVILLGGLYTPYGWSGGGGNTSHKLSGSLTGALYSLDEGLAEHLMQESSD